MAKKSHYARIPTLNILNFPEIFTCSEFYDESDIFFTNNKLIFSLKVDFYNIITYICIILKDVIKPEMGFVMTQ